MYVSPVRHTACQSVSLPMRVPSFHETYEFESEPNVTAFGAAADAQFEAVITGVPIRRQSADLHASSSPFAQKHFTWPLDSRQTTSAQSAIKCLLSSRWLELRGLYDTLRKDPVDAHQLESIAVTNESKGKLLEWSLRDGHWAVVAHLQDIGLSNKMKRKAFSKVAGIGQVAETSACGVWLSSACSTPIDPMAHKLVNASLERSARTVPDDTKSGLDWTGSAQGKEEAVAFAVGLAAMAAKFDERASELLDHEVVKIPCWLLAECIRLDGPGGKRLLEKCFRSRGGRLKWVMPGGDEVVHDQRAFVGSSPNTVVSADEQGLSAPIDTLLPHKLELVDPLDRWSVTRTSTEVHAFIVKDVCCYEVIEALAVCPSNGCLSTDAARAIIEQAWLGALVPYTLDSALNMVYVMVLCQATGIVRHGEAMPVAWEIILALISSKDILEEILQFRMAFVSVHGERCQVVRAICGYICTLEQISDWSGIIVDVVGIVAICGEMDDSMRRTIIALWGSVRWVRALYGLRGYSCIGEKMLPILNALQDTMIFMMVVAFFLAAAVHAYYALGVRSEPTALYASILVMFRLSLFGDFDLFELEGVDPSYVPNNGAWEPHDPDPTHMYVPIHVLFFIVGACITLTLMNLLIGILSANYDRFEDQSIQIFLRSRARILVRHAARPWACLPWYLPLLYSKISCKDRVNRNGYLWVATQAEINIDQVRSMRTIFREELRRASQRSELRDK